MNIVKGVADLIRRSSGGHHGESTSGSFGERFTLPAQNVCFSEIGNESVLRIVWERYEKIVDKEEKRRMLHVFLKQFVEVHKKWKPVVSGEDLEATSSNISTAEHLSRSCESIVGCSSGHPNEFILSLLEEITQLTSLVSDLDMRALKYRSDSPMVTTGLRITSEGLVVLEALMIVVRSMRNCRVVGYYGGVSKLVALIKASVVQLKAIAGALAVDDNLSNYDAHTFELLKKLLVYVASVLCSFMDFNSNAYEMTLICCTTFPMQHDSTSVIDPSSIFKIHHEKMYPWKQTAVISVMEAGGLNWLVGKSFSVQLEDWGSRNGGQIFRFNI